MMQLSFKILIGMVLGVIAGLVAGPTSAPLLHVWVTPVGTLFVNFLKMIIIPVVLVSLIVGVSTMGDIKKLGRTGAKLMTFYLLTTAFAVAFGVFLGAVMQPGKGLIIPVDANVALKAMLPISDALVNVVPTNAFQAMAKTDILQVIVFAIFIGLGITMAGDKAKPVKAFFEGLAEVT
ncbi:MAG TPA: cation:dicarboxylase symporter family transporter, partial [Negativicutes bacterium]|nr:cation:dicarboxylase symporter family transporter [Negativicutes bacterium]